MLENSKFSSKDVVLTADYVYLSNVTFSKGSRLYIYCNPEHLYFEKINLVPTVYEKQFTEELKSDSDLQQLLDSLN